MVFKRALLILSAVSALVFFSAFELPRDDEVIGTVPWLLTATSDKNALYQQCSLGDAMADALVRYTGADIAIVNGGDLIGNLPSGDVTAALLNECIVQNRAVATVQITGAELRGLLEHAVSHVTLADGNQYDAENSANGAFPQISGFRMYYDPAAEAGQRVVRVLYRDEPVDAGAVFTLAASSNMLTGGYGFPARSGFEETGETLSSVMAQYIRDGMEDYSRPQTRVYAMGVASAARSSRYYGVVLVGIVVVLILTANVSVVRVRRKKDMDYRQLSLELLDERDNERSGQ